MKAKKKWMFLGLTVLVVVAAGLGYWKRIGIRNTLYRMLDKQIPLTGDVYGYYGQEVKVKENLNEETSFQMEDSYADKIDTTITKESSMVDTSWQIDQQIEAEVQSGAYTFEEPEVIMDPYQISPLTGVAVFQTDEEYRVRVTVKGKTKEADITGVTVKAKGHRVPIIGLYPKTENSVKLELLDDNDQTIKEMELKVQTDGLPEEMDDMVSVEKSSGESAHGLTIISGQGVYYPFAYDVNGDIRWYLNHRTSTYGVFQLSNGNYIMQDNYGYVSSVTKSFPAVLYEMDYLGRAVQMYLVPHGTHHEIIEKEPDGNLLILTSTLQDHVDDKIIELDRKSGEIVNSLEMTELFGNDYTEDVIDWAHLNTVSYQAEDDTILISPRNLNSGVKLNWTTHEIVWILANPEVFKGTKYEKYVLTPDSDFLWHYRQHTVYQIDTDLDGNPDTVEITMFDNHRNPEADYYDHEKGSFVTVYAVNEKEKTVSLLKKLPVVKANVTSNTTYDADSGHIFGMCGTVKSGTAKTGMTYEFDYESGEILNQYYINKNYYRAIELKANYETMSEAMQQPENYIKGTLRPLMETTARIAEPTQQLSEGLNFKLTAGILFAEMRNRQVSQIIFKGENKSYVYDQSFLKLREEDYLLRTESIPIPLTTVEKGTYQIYCVYQDGYYDTAQTITIK
ncbi:aryl-sulfate sulfotransferase [Faecalicatena fissicatena]|jgi:hypothetical protein|uniref:aryl-sulfate sulfotransferase n=1 Tax=Faecalicatena fissicatena TaxID=290055 RepID=UPI0015703D40|nr:aryl-sulfate sulfotransferase [Faecalicatena fissicatena]MBP8796486.1 aryl-sulfate sulfotransferase [Lachnospiraceae bacterium]NSE34077.1 aryl-sulfate sulfotransferase [Faecalicatena fissicatena]